MTHFWIKAAGAAAVMTLAVGVASGGAQAQAKKVPAAAGVTLPVSFLDYMRAAMEIPADGLWAVTSKDKLTDQEWLLADQDSTALVVATRLINTPGAGKGDAARMAKADWRGWAAQVQKEALDIRAAVKAKDLEKMGTAGDALAQTCLDCHTKYRPEIPSDGVNRFPFYPKRVLDTAKP